MASNVNDLEALRTATMERIRARFVKDGEFGMSEAMLFRLDGAMEMLALDLDFQDQRLEIQRRCAEHKVWLVHHIQEVWMVETDTTDPAAVAEVEAAAREKSLDRHPRRTERVLFTEESMSTSVRMWGADIERDSAGRASLGPFQEASLKLPWPGFKRYLPATGKPGSGATA